MIFAILMFVAGVVSTVVGIKQNNSIEAQLKSLWGSGQANPGTTWIVIGVVLIIAGFALLLYMRGRKE